VELLRHRPDPRATGAGESALPPCAATDPAGSSATGERDGTEGAPPPPMDGTGLDLRCRGREEADRGGALLLARDGRGGTSRDGRGGTSREGRRRDGGRRGRSA
jgi:hypothetical protein